MEKVLIQEKSVIRKVDIIVPVYNEEKCFEEFFNRINETFENSIYDISIIFIDDGSTDGSLYLIKERSYEKENVHYVSFSRNFGKEAALTAGIEYCSGDAVAIIDADLQDAPELLPKMLEYLENTGADVVYGKRISRRGEKFFKKITAKIFYVLFDQLSRFQFPRDTGDFRVMRKRVVTSLSLVKEKNRFMKGLFAWVGFRQVEFLYDRDPRHQGDSKFNFKKLWSFALDGFVAFTTVPLKIATYVGFMISLFALVYASVFILKTMIWGDEVRGFPTLIVVLSFFSGVQVFFLGVIGEYIARIHDEVKNRPVYIVKEKKIIDK